MFDDINDMATLTRRFYKKREKLSRTGNLRDFSANMRTLQEAFNSRRAALTSSV